MCQSTTGPHPPARRQAAPPQCAPGRISLQLRPGHARMCTIPRALHRNARADPPPLSFAPCGGPVVAQPRNPDSQGPDPSCCSTRCGCTVSARFASLPPATSVWTPARTSAWSGTRASVWSPAWHPRRLLQIGLPILALAMPPGHALALGQPGNLPRRPPPLRPSPPAVSSWPAATYARRHPERPTGVRAGIGTSSLRRRPCRRRIHRGIHICHIDHQGFPILHAVHRTVHQNRPGRRLASCRPDDHHRRPRPGADPLP